MKNSEDDKRYVIWFPWKQKKNGVQLLDEMRNVMGIEHLQNLHLVNGLIVTTVVVIALMMHHALAVRHQYQL